MCGICGIVRETPIAAPELHDVRRMTDRMRHRGPDGEGFFDDRHVSLGMRRLSIIDLEGGRQPLYNETHTVALVANAEIYNYRELRAELIARGHVFATKSDCEVIAHLYEECGRDAVSQLRGMFAFALWDHGLNRLVLARDRMGEKPLYMSIKKGEIVFASEMKALLGAGRTRFVLNPESIDRFFHYMYVPEPATAVQGVSKLPAASTLVVDIAPWRVDERVYWDMEAVEPLSEDPTPVLSDCLDEIGRIVVRSDVPVGVALSGGLDSSLVAALAARNVGTELCAFTVGYEGTPESDERADARELARYLNIPIVEAELSTDDMVNAFDDLNRWRDDPIADVAGYGYHEVMRLARKSGVPVILQGQGGDELFWGYPWMQRAVDESRLRRAVNQHPYMAWLFYLARIRLAKPGGRELWRLRRWMQEWGGIKAFRKWIEKHRDAPRDRLTFMDLETGFDQMQGERGNLYSCGMLSELESSRVDDLFSVVGDWPREDIRLTKLICETYLRCNGIAQGERLSMACSVEARSPFLDHRLVESVIGLRKVHPDDHLAPKAWLREVAKPMLPDWVLRRRKRGFTPPVLEWEVELWRRHRHDVCNGYLIDSGIMRPERVHEIMGQPPPPQGGVPVSFKLLVLESWCRQMSKCIP